VSSIERSNSTRSERGADELEETIIALAKASDVVESELDRLKVQVVEVEEQVKRKELAIKRAEEKARELSLAAAAEEKARADEVRTLKAQLEKLAASRSAGGGAAGAASGGDTEQVLRTRLAAEQREKERLKLESEELAKEVAELSSQLEEEEAERLRLKKAAESKMAERNALKQRHQQEMKRLKKKLLDASLNEERVKSDIVRVIDDKSNVLESTYRLADDIAVTKAKLSDEQQVKAEIADTKRRIQLELERVRNSLTTEKQELHKVELTAGRLERVHRRVEHKVKEEEFAVRMALRDKDVLEVEQEEIRDELDDVMTQKRQEELRALHLQVEAEELDDAVALERDVHQDEIKKINVVHKTELEQLRRKHETEKRKALFEASELVDKQQRDAVKLQDAKDKQFELLNQKRELARDAVRLNADIAMTEQEKAEAKAEAEKAKAAQALAKDKLKDVKHAAKDAEASRKKLERQAEKLKAQGDEELSTKAEIDRLKKHLQSEMNDLKQQLDNEERAKRRAARQRELAAEETTVLESEIKAEDRSIAQALKQRELRVAADNARLESHAKSKVDKLAAGTKLVEEAAKAAAEHIDEERAARARVQRDADALSRRTQAELDKVAAVSDEGSSAAKKKRDFERQLAAAKAQLEAETGEKKKKEKEKTQIGTELERAKAAAARAKEEAAVLQAQIAAREQALEDAKRATDKQARAANRALQGERFDTLETVTTEATESAVGDKVKAKLEQIKQRNEEEKQRVERELADEAVAAERKRRDLERRLLEREQEVETLRQARQLAESRKTRGRTTTSDAPAPAIVANGDD